MKRKWKLALAALCACAVVTAAYAATAGGAEDPLITLSYLEGPFMAQVQTMVDEAVSANQEILESKLNAAIDELESRLSTEDSGSFQVVTLTKGQTLVGDVGCEVMLRIGTADCGSDSATGLIDTTGGSVLGDGEALAANHLYMVTISTRSVIATSNTVKVLVRGPYTVG